MSAPARRGSSRREKTHVGWYGAPGVELLDDVAYDPCMGHEPMSADMFDKLWITGGVDIC
jgi:hypothetical protein